MSTIVDLVQWIVTLANEKDDWKARADRAEAEVARLRACVKELEQSSGAK